MREEGLYILSNEEDTVRCLVIDKGGAAVDMQTGQHEDITIAIMCVKGEKPYPPLATNMPAKLLAMQICKKFNLTMLNPQEEIPN